MNWRVEETIPKTGGGQRFIQVKLTHIPPSLAVKRLQKLVCRWTSKGQLNSTTEQLLLQNWRFSPGFAGLDLWGKNMLPSLHGIRDCHCLFAGTHRVSGFRVAERTCRGIKTFPRCHNPDSTVLGSPHHYHHVAADLTLFRQEMGRKSQALIIYPCVPHLHGDVGTIPRLIGHFSAAPTHRVSKNIAFSEDERMLLLGLFVSRTRIST